MSQYVQRKAFTLVELIIVIAVAAILAVGIFVASKPQKRMGETNDAKRKNDAQAFEQAIKMLAADSGVMPTELKNLTENQKFAIVKAGGLTTGTFSCAALGTSIDKKDISSALSSVLPQMPMDPDLSASSNETGYYIVRRGSSYDIEPCNTYELAATSGSKQMCGDGYCGSSESCSSCAQDCGTCPAVCGNGTVEGSEVCDDGDTSTESCGNSTVESGGAIYCNANCSSSITLNEQCDDGNSSNLDTCLNSCMNVSCGDTYCNAAETCSSCSTDCGVCKQAYTAGPNYAGTGADGGGFDVAWITPTNIVSDNSSYAQAHGIGFSGTINDGWVKLIKADGNYSAENKSLGDWPISPSIVSYGGEGQLWGETWTATDINSSNFGFGIASDSFIMNSNILRATSFGFNIPESATITGIKVEVKKYQYTTSKPFDSFARIDSVKITVYYNN